MQPLQDDLRTPAAKDNSITHAATASSNLHAAITMRSAETELQNTRELRAMASEIVAPKPDLDARAKKKTILKHFLKGFLEGKSLAPKWRKSADKSLSQPSCSHSNTIYEVQLQKTIVLRCSRGTKQPWRSHYNAICKDWVAKHNRTTRNWVANCSSKTGSRRQSEKKTILKHFLKRFLKGKLLAPKWRKSANKSQVAAFMQPLQDDLRSPAAKDNSITHAAVARSNLDAAITMRSAETELQNTIELRATGSEIAAPKPDLDARAKKKTILKHFLKGFLKRKSLAPKWRKSADKSLSQPSCSHSNTIYEVQLQKTIVLRMQPKEEATLAIPFTLRERSYSCKAQWNSIGNSSTSTTCNPIYSEGTILELQITMEFHRQLIHQHHLQPHLQCGNDPTVANHNGILSTTHARKTVETPFTMRNRSENDPRISDHDPTTHETVSHPSHRRGRSSRFGDELCMEKHRLSCICYLSKTHFVRDFLQNSIGNSSTSTTCNPIYSEGTILELQITMEFHRQLIP